MPEVGGGSLSQCCQWLSPVMQIKLTKVHFETRELVLAFVAGFDKSPKIGRHVWIYTGNKLTKFHGNILSLSENIAKRLGGGATFLTHTVHT